MDVDPPHMQPALRQRPFPLVEAIVVHIQPVDQALIDYIVFLGQVLLIATPTPIPYTMAAQALLALGYDPARQLLMRRVGVNVNQLSYALGDAALLNVENQQVLNPLIRSVFISPIVLDGPGAVP